jgi:serine/threonine-protein kinase
MKECENIKGVMPLVDHCALEKDSGIIIPWFVMPIAEPLHKYAQSKSIDEIVDIILSIAKTIKELHKKRISHRDIKPSNLFFFDNDYYIGDFGLVHFPNKKDLTKYEKRLGPLWTIAPEMRRNPGKADGLCADIYSLAKTLWILLTKEKMGFDGQYIPGDESIGLSNNQQFRNVYLSKIDELLIKCTEHKPSKRPKIDEFINDLSEWKKLCKDLIIRNPIQWKEISKTLFYNVCPKRAIWQDLNDIVNALNEACKYKNLNHLIFPESGGLDLIKAQISIEPECIELEFDGSIGIVKPKRLIFESFKEDTQWNYFRMETDRMDSIAPYTPKEAFKESVVEIKLGIYTDIDCHIYNDFNGGELPDSSRIITRFLRGDFVLFQKTSIYNKMPVTYSGLHNKCSTDDFRIIIEKLIEKINGKKQELLVASPEYVEPDIFRKNNTILSKNDIELIRKVIDLKIDAVNESRIMNGKLGQKNNAKSFSDRDVEDYYSEPKPKQKQFCEFLEKLDIKKLQLLFAVMDGGRTFMTKGRTYTLDEMIESFSNEDKKSIIYSFESKSALAKYLEIGIENYKKKDGHLRKTE